MELSGGASLCGRRRGAGLAHEKAVFHGSAYPVNLQFGTPSSLRFGTSSNDTFSVRATLDATAPAVGSLRRRRCLTGGLAAAHLEATSDLFDQPTRMSQIAVPAQRLRDQYRQDWRVFSKVEL